MSSSRRRRSSAFWAVVAAAIVAALAPASASAKDALTLRVNDAIAEPGGLAAVVIRTYASKPITQGQVCFFARATGRARAGAAFATASTAAGVFDSLVSVRVFGKRRDVVTSARIEPAGGAQMVVLEFTSDTGSINRSDGPLAVLIFRVSQNVAAGATYELAIDPGNTFVRDRQGQPVRLEPRAGELDIRHPADSYVASADGDRVRPGERAELGVETYEPVAMSGGQIGFLYDDDVAAGRPRVKMSRRYGKRRYSVDRSTPGLVLVTFESRNDSWNRVPGQIVSIDLPTSPRVAPGTRRPVSIDPSLTFFLDEQGDPLPYRFEKDVLRFETGNGGGGGGDGGDSDDDD